VNTAEVAHYYKEPHPYFDHDVLVVGAKNSAAIAALELFWTGARVTLVHRGDAIHRHVKYWIKPNIENRLAAGEIRGYFNTTVKEIREKEVVLNTPQGEVTIANDFVFAMVGYTPDWKFLNLAGITLTLQPAARAPMKPRSRASARASIWQGVIVAGMHTNEIFIENWQRFHGRQIAEGIRSSLQDYFETRSPAIAVSSCEE
jgi:thioredoxin reductase (NADPH)